MNNLNIFMCNLASNFCVKYVTATRRSAVATTAHRAFLTLQLQTQYYHNIYSAYSK